MNNEDYIVNTHIRISTVAQLRDFFTIIMPYYYISHVYKFYIAQRSMFLELSEFASGGKGIENI